MAARLCVLASPIQQSGRVPVRTTEGLERIDARHTGVMRHADQVHGRRLYGKAAEQAKAQTLYTFSKQQLKRCRIT